MNKFNLAIPLVSIAFVGCTSHYLVPSTSATATIKFVKSPSQNYAVHTYLEPSSCSDRKLVLRTDEPGKEVLFDATKDISLTLGADTGYAVNTVYGCFVTFTFTPESGGQYVSEYSIHGEGCAASFKKITPRGYEDVSIKPRKWTRGFSESSSWCKD